MPDIVLSISVTGLVHDQSVKKWNGVYGVKYCTKQSAWVETVHHLKKWQAAWAKRGSDRKNRKENLSPPTRHENGPVSTQVPFPLRDFAFYRNRKTDLARNQNNVVCPQQNNSWYKKRKFSLTTNNDLIVIIKQIKFCVPLHEQQTCIEYQ